MNAPVEDIYIIARWTYSIGEPVVDDTTYRTLHDSINMVNSLPEYINRSWSSDPCPEDLLRKYNMEEYIINITLTDKTESMPTLNTWEEIQHKFKDESYPKVISYKLDGFNTQPAYYAKRPISMKTRGRHQDALNISDYIKYLPQEVQYFESETRLAGELVLSFDNFEKLKEMFPDRKLKSIRSSVRSALSDERAHKLLTFIPFNYVSKEATTRDLLMKYMQFKSSGFEDPRPTVAMDFENLMSAIRSMQYNAKDYPYPTDGLVISSWDGEDHVAVRVGKWEEPVYYSFIETYDESHGPSRIGVKVKIEPTNTGNTTQNLVNITNYAQVMAMQLFPGTPIAFKLRSHAIADIDWVATKALQKMYKQNPEMITKMINDRRLKE